MGRYGADDIVWRSTRYAIGQDVIDVDIIALQFETLRYRVILNVNGRFRHNYCQYCDSQQLGEVAAESLIQQYASDHAARAYEWDYGYYMASFAYLD